MPPETSTDTAQVAGNIAALLRAEHFGNGPRAALRRMQPDDLAEPALQRLLAEQVPDAWLSPRGMSDWGLIVHALALGSPDNLLGAKPFGAALAQAQYSESRLARLLAADRAQLNKVLPRACRFLVAKGESLHPADIANFVLDVSSTNRADAGRTRVARRFYAAARNTATTQV